MEAFFWRSILSKAILFPPSVSITRLRQFFLIDFLKVLNLTIFALLGLKGCPFNRGLVSPYEPSTPSPTRGLLPNSRIPNLKLYFRSNSDTIFFSSWTAELSALMFGDTSFGSPKLDSLLYDSGEDVGDKEVLLVLCRAARN